MSGLCDTLSLCFKNTSPGARHIVFHARATFKGASQFDQLVWQFGLIRIISILLCIRDRRQCPDWFTYRKSTSPLIIVDGLINREIGVSDSAPQEVRTTSFGIVLRNCGIVIRDDFVLVLIRDITEIGNPLSLYTLNQLAALQKLDRAAMYPPVNVDVRYRINNIFVEASLTIICA